MNPSTSILMDIREAVGLSKEDPNFDKELTMHINAALGTLNQNGVGKFLIVIDKTPTWDDFKDPTQIGGNEYYQLVPLYVALSTKLLFDPPPPSSVEYHSKSAKELLWRLKVAYETKTVIEEVILE